MLIITRHFTYIAYKISNPSDIIFTSSNFTVSSTRFHYSGNSVHSFIHSLPVSLPVRRFYGFTELVFGTRCGGGVQQDATCR